MNPQGYAGANPVMNTDPSGLRFVPDEGLAEQGGGYGRTEDLTPDDGFDAQAYYSPQNEEVYPGPDPDPTPPAANGDPAADAAPPAAASDSSSKDQGFYDKYQDFVETFTGWTDTASDTLDVAGAVGFVAVAGAGCYAGPGCAAAVGGAYVAAQAAWKASAFLTLVGAAAKCSAADWDGCLTSAFWGGVGFTLGGMAPLGLEERVAVAAMAAGGVALSHLADGLRDW